MVARKERSMREKLPPQERRRAWLYAALIVLTALVCAILVWRIAGQEYRAVSLPSTKEAVLRAAQDLDSITIDATFDPYSKRLAATQVMTLRNPAGTDLDNVTLRSYSGAYLRQDTSPVANDELFAASYGQRFSTGGLILDSAMVNGEKVQHTWADEAKTVLTLPADWPVGAEITVTLKYHVNIPDCGSRFGVQEEIFALGNVFPTLALWQDGTWRTEAYVSIGDPFLTACANWTLRLTLPRDYAVAATGYAQPAYVGDAAVYTMQAQAVRDFALVISDQFQTAAGMANDVLVTAYAKDASAARRMLKFARQAIECFERHYGEYIYPTLTLAEVDFPFGGMEYPRLVMIGSSLMDTKDDSLEITVAHEVAHQWWYAMVGSDSYYQAWQDESLCEYALMDYVGQVYGASARRNLIFDRIETAMRITIPRGVTPGSPIDYFQDLTEYSQVVYHRGAALWSALETLMGKEQLDAALRQYAEAFRFSIATREDLTRLLSQAAGQDLSPLMEDYLDIYILN